MAPERKPWNDLSPWLAAVGYSPEQRSPAGAEADVEQLATWAGQLFRLRVARGSDWVDHRVTVEAIAAPDPEIEYPREVPNASNRKRKS